MSKMVALGLSLKKNTRGQYHIACESTIAEKKGKAQILLYSLINRDCVQFLFQSLFNNTGLPGGGINISAISLHTHLAGQARYDHQYQ